MLCKDGSEGLGQARLTCGTNRFYRVIDSTRNVKVCALRLFYIHIAIMTKNF